MKIISRELLVGPLKAVVDKQMGNIELWTRIMIYKKTFLLNLPYSPFIDNKDLVWDALHHIGGSLC